MRQVHAPAGQLLLAAWALASWIQGRARVRLSSCCPGETVVRARRQVGWCLPHEFGGLIADLRAHTAGAEGVVFSTHCQNDLGLSTANSLAGAVAGARQIECTINGIGERAGNASLEEVVMAIDKRGCAALHPRPLNGQPGAAASAPAERRWSRR